MEILDAKSWTRPCGADEAGVQERVRALFAEIQSGGSEAVQAISRRFDGFEVQEIELMPFSDYGLAPELESSIRAAAARIEAFARAQSAAWQSFDLEDEFGQFGQRVIALERMAAYIPGGRFPLLSTALMTLIPARVAGVISRTALSPSTHPALLAAASLAGATRFVRIGGAQAVFAAAFGLAGLEAVDMLVGPGNAYVNSAKAIVQERIKIDTLAGPSELLVLSDGSAPLEWVVFDIIAQAEHDPMALSVLASCDRDYLERAGERIEAELARSPGTRAGLAQLVWAEDATALCEFSNRMAPEHLLVAASPDFIRESELRQYGSLFMGKYSAVALGDYCSGPNHTLPTLGRARQKGGLQVGDFLKIQTVQRVRKQGCAALAAIAIPMAEAEGLTYHRKSLEVRLK